MKKLYYVLFIINLVECGITLHGMDYELSTEQETHYTILGVSNSATSEEIKKAYKKKASQYHPDKNYGNEKDAEEMFKSIANAYDVLKDAQERIKYDNSLHDSGFADSSVNNHFTNYANCSNYNFKSMPEVLCGFCKGGTSWRWTSVGCCLFGRLCYACVGFMRENEESIECSHCFTLLSVVNAAYNNGLYYGNDTYYNVKKG